MAEPAVTLEEIRTFTDEQLPFCGALGITCEAVSPGEAIARFHYNEAWTRPVAFISGPVMMALADVALYYALLTRTGIVPLALTNELKINFLRPAVGDDLLARARLLKLGRTVAYGDVDIYTPSDPDRLVAHATTSYILPRDEVGRLNPIPR